MNYLSFGAITAASVFLAAGVSAASYDFDLTFDGTSISVDGGSDVPGGTSLNVGDDFTLDLAAAGNDYWSVDSAYSTFVSLVFLVGDSGSRSADVVTKFFLDGAEVHSMVQNGLSQQYFHVGSQDWNLAAGLLFDAVSVSYSLLASDNSTVISSIPDIFEDFGSADSPFFRSDKISYVSAVPLPASGLLYLTFLAGAGAIARRRKG